MTAICASHYRNPLNDYVGKKHHHKNRFRQRQSSRSAFYQPGLKVIESRNVGENHETKNTPIRENEPEPSQQLKGNWGFRPSALQYKDYGKGDMSVSEIVDCYVRDNERAEQEGVAIPPRPSLKRRLCHKHVRDALFSASTSSSTTNNSTTSSKSLLRCLQWNIQAFLSPKDERNMHTITAGIIRSICETDSDVLILNEIHWREMENHNPHYNENNNHHQQQAIQNSQALLEEVLRLRGYHFAKIASHGDTPTMVATRKKVLRSKEVVLSCNRSALCLLIETDNQSSKCWVVGTHLDAFDAEFRRMEIRRLLQETTGPNIPVIIAGDFNQQRSRDYTPLEWKNVASSAHLRGVPLDDGVASILESKGFQCILDTVNTNTNSSSSEHVKCNWNPQQPPPSTHWSGTTIDYTYYSNPQHHQQNQGDSTTTTIHPHGVYVGSAGFSDHRMTVTDWTLTTTTQRSTTKEVHKPRHIDKSFFFHHLPEGRHHSWLYSYQHRNHHYQQRQNNGNKK